MRLTNILMASLLLLSWFAPACAVNPSQNHGQPSAPSESKVYQVEVENPLHQERVKHPDCLSLREDKYCKKWRQDKCREWGVRYVCEKWRSTPLRAPADGAANPAGR